MSFCISQRTFQREGWPQGAYPVARWLRAACAWPSVSRRPVGFYFQATAAMPAVVVVGAVAAVAATRRSPSSWWRGAHRVASSQQPVRQTLRGQLAACKIPIDGF